jgi:hypothetical protein
VEDDDDDDDVVEADGSRVCVPCLAATANDAATADADAVEAEE